MAAAKSNAKSEEIAKLGSEIFHQRIQPALKPEDDGKYVAVDIDSGDYELDADDYSAVMRLRTRHPKARIWLERAGLPTAYQLRRRS